MPVSTLKEMLKHRGSITGPHCDCLLYWFHIGIVDKLDKAQSLALTTDSWASRATESYLTVTVHYISNWELKSAVLQTCPLYEIHRSAHLAEELTNVVNGSWGGQTFMW